MYAARSHCSYCRKLREKCVASAPAIAPLSVPKRTSDIHIEKKRSANLLTYGYFGRNTDRSDTRIMLNDLPPDQQTYIVTEYTDLCRFIDGLAEIVQGQLHLDSFSTALFLFCGRCRDRIKGLF